MSSWYSGPEFVKKAYKQNATRYGMKKTIALGDRNGIEEKMRRAAEKRNQRALTRRQAAKIKFDEDFPEGYFEGRDGTIHHSLSSVAKGSGMVHAIDYEEEDDDEIFQSIYGDAKEFKAQEQPTEDKQTVEFNGFEFAHCASTYTCPAKHEPALVFGSITPEILSAAQLKSSGAVEQKVQQTTLAMVASDSDLSQGVISARRTIAKEMAEREATLEKFDERFVHKEREEVRKYISPMQVLHSAPWRMRELPSAVRRERRVKRKDEDLTIQPNLITKLDTHMEVKELDNEDSTKAMAKQSKKARAFVRHKTIRLTQQQIDNLIDQVLVLANKCKLGIELGYKKMNKLRVIRKKKRLFLSVQLRHEVGNFKPHDMKNNSFLEDIAQKFNQKHNENLVFVAENFKPGDSGLVVSDGKIYGARMRGKNQLFIVRGDIRGILCDARANIRKKYRSMRHYSSNTALQFWKGFENEFIADRDTERDHACTSNFSVNQCGEIAGVVTQAINPCGRITCLKCAEHLDSLTRLEYGVAVSPRIERGIEKIKSKFPAFAHVLRMLKLLQYASTTNNTNTSGHEKIFKMVGDIKEAPFSHINRINDGLIRGGELRSEEFSEMTESLLEIARFLKNRTDVIASNDLSRFRNKVSGKAHINVDLMCDNQLDKNGNFLWGTRGYHAKRFLSNFFEAIDPELGYQAYIIRRNPNGARRLAIDRLMVPTNFEKFRQQMEGNQVHNVQISEECVSRKGDRFVYPCCCVTHEDGTADVSGFELPTKHHLVVGNTGDSKFVDLPQNEDLNLYIAKDGFCYINLFFAMLINVREEQAKDFTKKVRDTMIPKLGAWPKLKDVATACHMLTVFFPDTLNAELPRILVDHNQKMLHVLDSYGSADTGFHKLKANTISQLILFSHDSLKSNLREYGVGGRFSAAESPNMCFKWLIKGIYKPQFMLRIIEDEPYLLLMSLISPSVLIALFNSGSLEEAVRYWINRDQSLTQMMNMLAILASKVSVSKSFVTQMQLLQSSAPRFIESTDQKFYVCHSVATVQQVLAQMVRESNMNEPLVDSGFVDTNWQFKQMVEKNYIEDLETAWQELSCAQKFSITMRSRKLHGMYSKFTLPDVTKDSQGKLSRFSPSSLGWRKFSLRNQFKNLYDGMRSLVKRMVCKLLCVCISNVRYLIPDVFRFVNVLLVVGALLAIFRTVHMHILEYRELQKVRSEQAERHKWKILMSHYTALRNKLNGSPTESEFVEYVEQFDAPLADWFKKNTSVEFAFQNKTQGVDSLQKVVAMVALLLMVFDSERSDGVYRILNKLKGIMTTIQSEPMKFQSIDDTHEIFEEKNLTIDFELEGVSSVANRMAGNTFEEWWNNQLRNNNIVEHYRTGGQFVEFTRDTAASVALDIAHGSNFEYLVRGAVGSGKSTGLPFHLSRKGRVLMLEPTKPLAENVFRQLKKDPFFVNPSLRMRGTTCIGSTPIDIMTSGYALHYYANNVANLRQLEFVIIDECHVHDANAIAFVCLLREYGFGGKLIKASATPVGREVEFTTQKPVTLLVEEDMSMSAFVRNLGTGANSDVTQHGENILVYVASYNEVDNMSKMLIDKGYRVTKVDGRTMKSGNVEIETKGTAAQRHFIVATNIIENGVTLDIDVVVDFGVKVLPELDIDARLIRYKKVSISYGERIQRLGRVGRHKSGTALRIGETLKGVQQVPAIVATEAAFYCFAYGLPVMTEGVTTSLLANCTNMQARTMLNFELPIFFMAPLVRFDGTMHAAIHKELVPYKLRDSEIILNRLAVPSASYKNWSTVRELAMHGYRLSLDESVRTPFYARDIPDKLIQVINDAVLNHKKDAGFGPLTAVGAAKMAYTLQTEPHRLQMTVQILEGLIKKELEKEAYFENVTSVSCLSSNTSINDIVRSIRSRYAVNRTKENLGVLQAARAQLLEFKNIGMHLDPRGNISEFGALECMQFQSENDMSKHLKLKGHWNRSLVTSDAIVAGGVLAGGVWMIYTYFKERCSEKFTFQAKNKRQRQKLKFRAARDNKMAREIYGDDECMEHYFGSRYTAKGKKSGTTKGMGAKTRRFINMYGFEPTDYSFARYVDPLTGATLDEGVLTDISMVQEHFGKIRHDFIARDELDKAAVSYDPKIQAYFVKDVAKKVLKVDLTPHNPFQMGEKGVNIAGYPERDRELRQTGKAVEVAYSALPAQNEIDIENTFEGRSTFYGLRDYNPIATCVCKLQNDSDGVVTTLYGIGYGPMIIVNQHLFRLNNGTLKVESHHGEFIVKNTTELKMFPLEGRDIMLLRMPKDFVPFPQKLQFRVTEKGESVCMVGSNFQTRSISSTVSATSVTAPSQSEGFIKHWLTTKDGQCGLPIVAPKDGKIVGLHSLTSTVSTTNMYTTFPEDFTEKYLKNHENLEWVRKWKLNVDKANWGPVNIKDDLPSTLFRIQKDLRPLNDTEWNFQGAQDWMMNQLEGNLKAVAQSDSNLVTKHVVKGKCALFQLYLETHEEAKQYFQPLLGAYQKSKLNKDAYIKDFKKYATPIVVGQVNCDKFEIAQQKVIGMFEEKGFDTCNYITNEQDIFGALNMNAAVGAMYRGKKKDYFQDFTDVDKEQLLRASCERAYFGKFGVWNGSLKAELRPLEKCLANKTRSFTAAPIDTLLSGKVCVDDFNNKFYALHFGLPSSVGMTKFYGGWNKLLDLLPTGWIYCDADGSQFDSSLTPYLINAVLEIRLKFMEDWDIGKQMLENLYTEIVYTPILTPDGTVVKKHKGNNSGQPSTVVDNTIMVILAVYYAVECLDIKEEISEYLRFLVNGDDLLIAVRPDREFILDTFEHSFSQLGLKYTFVERHSDKGSLWFMSHQGRLRDGLYIPKLESERVVSILEWDRAKAPENRLEALCAAMIEAWGNDELLEHVRKFYYWVLEQAPYSELSKTGKAPYISELALESLYKGVTPDAEELERYACLLDGSSDDDEFEEFIFQANDQEIDAGKSGGNKTKEKERASSSGTDGTAHAGASEKDRDVNAGSKGLFPVPRMKSIVSKKRIPTVRGKGIFNLEHFISYEPQQEDLSNARSTQTQFDMWYDGVKDAYGLDDSGMEIILNGLLVYCIENGTSPNLVGNWIMMDGDKQVEFPLAPLFEHAKPTFRQIMAHYSGLAEAYILKRNATKPYMPRWALKRNLQDFSLAQYAFDFYEMTSKTPNRAREAHAQMKAAALHNTKTKLFGLDGNVGGSEEDTERHTIQDVNRNMHNLLGMKM